MKYGDKRIFSDPKKLAEMLALRNQGWSSIRLALKYKCDHSSILNQISKNSSPRVRRNLYDSKRLTNKGVPALTAEDIKSGIVKMNLGKDYADYLKEIRKKKRLIRFIKYR